MVTFGKKIRVRRYKISTEELEEKKMAYQLINKLKSYNYMSMFHERLYDEELWSIYHVGECKQIEVKSRFHIISPIPIKIVHSTNKSYNMYQEYSYPADPETLTRKQIIEYIFDDGDIYYLKNNNFKNKKYTYKNFRIKDLYKHYNEIREGNDIYC